MNFKTVFSPLLFFAWLALQPNGWTSAREDVREIANPRDNGRWVVDLTGTLTQEELDRVNTFSENIFRSNQIQMITVMIGTTEQKPIEDFALELFNRWEIGTAKDQNGLLFLVAKDDHSMRIQLGRGIGGADQMKTAQEILDNEVTPLFRKEDFGKGLYTGTFATAMQILKLGESGELDDSSQPPPVPSQENPQSRFNFANDPAGSRRKESFPWFPIGLFGSIAGAAILFGFILRKRNRYHDRNCSVCGNQLVLLSEEQDDELLDLPERIEEQIGSVDYDVWACLKCENVLKLRYGKWFTRYSRCPSCNYVTKSRIQQTVVAATRSHGGQVRVTERCENCNYHNVYSYTTPRIVDTVSSPPGHSSQGHGGGGNISGGGSSSGAGATGHW